MSINSLKDIGLGTKIEVMDQGTGQVVVLIHGWPITPYHWRFILPALHRAGYRTLSITLRGLGGQSEGAGNLEKSTIANEVRLLLDKLEVAKYAIIGHDWGGTIAYLLSIRNPTECKALIVEEEIFPGIDVDIPHPGSEYYPKWHGPFNRAIGLAEELIQGREAIYYRKFLLESAGKNKLDDRAIYEYVSAYTMDQNIESQLGYSLGYYRTSKQDSEQIKLSIVNSLDIPILAVGGEFGMGKAVEQGLRRIGSNLSGIVCEGAGHYPIEQTPEFCVPKIIEFLKVSFNI
ncbi:MAG: alpha/beta hydrolase [Kangiellaceae bacterium]|nr:alpha/beta hydrolase [Kangiellaceae bacterium]